MALPSPLTLLAAIPLLPLLLFLLVPYAFQLWGHSLRAGSQARRNLIYSASGQEARQHNAKPNFPQQETEADDDDSWEKVDAASNGQKPKPVTDDSYAGIVGFFHPFCNAGGGGERVLWAAIAATQQKWPKAICAVYTGDQGLDKAVLVSTVKDRFDISLGPERLHLVHLTTRHFVLASTYPRFTLLGQSLGSLVPALEALSLLVPDIFVDTMGYAFALAFCKLLFPSLPTAAYVHYPTISTDMLSSLDDKTGQTGLNSGLGSGWRGWAKKRYWQLFARFYSLAGSRIDLVMCNSTWTRNHITALWKPSASASALASSSSSSSSPSSSSSSSDTSSSTFASIVYPPCPVREISAKVSLGPSSPPRQHLILYIAQFRPEKNHALILRSFAKYFHSKQSWDKDPPSLVLIGSVRANTPDEKHVYNLRLLARELKINPITTFICDAPFSVIISHLQKASISVNGMWNEHFGIGNVEALSAGVIPVVHRSGGPYLDIVVDFEGQPIGYHAENEAEYAAAFHKVHELDDQQSLEMRQRGQRSVARFSDEVFAQKWGQNLNILIGKQQRH